jgi:hypothetical protein
VTRSLRVATTPDVRFDASAFSILMNLKVDPGPLITALLLPIVFASLYAASKRGARRVGNVTIVEYPGAAKALGIAAVGASALMIFVAFRAPEEQRKMALMICGSFALLFFFLPLEFTFRRIEFDDETIVIRCAWRKMRRILWVDVISFTELPRQKEWVLESKSHGKIKLSTFLRGLPDLRAAAIKHGKPV